MEYILMNCVLALLDYPGATLLGINRLLVDKEYRTRVIAKIRDPIVKTFWVAEFASWSEKYATEAIAPVQNKVGQFLSSSVIRNIVAQVKSTIDLRHIMDDGKILIVNLSKGRIGEDNMRLLGGMLITKIQLAAQERQNMPEIDRRDFYLYVDEFQNFANESFAAILSEARKYRLNLIVAHQYIEQLDEKVSPAIFGNVGTIIAMRVGGADAEFMETEFSPTFLPEDLVNLAKTQIYLKLMVDGVSTPPFSANTLGPIAKRTGNVDKVVGVSRERYAEPRPIIEEKVLKWSGMELAVSGAVQSEGMNAAAESEGGNIHYPSIKTDEERVVEEAAAEASAAGALETAATIKDTTEYLTIRPERLEAIRASLPPQKKEKPKFPHTCNRCGKVFTLPLQLDPTRPIFCAECRPIIMEERKQRGSVIRQVLKAPVLPEQTTAPVVGEPSESSFGFKNQNVSKPRIVRDESRPPLPRGTIKIVKDDAPAESLIEEIARTKGQPIETRKKEVERRAGEATTGDAPAKPPAPRPAGSGNRGRGERGGRDRGGRSPDRDRGPRRAPPSRPESAPQDDGPIQLDVPPAPSVPSVPKPAPPAPVVSAPAPSVSPHADKPVAPGQRIRFDAP